MANFMEELWNSIFTPGTTPTLLVATNVTFGALLFLLLCLLAATRSIHFLILSVLSLGLWVSINWFAKEVNQAHAREESLLKKDAKPSTTKSGTLSDASVDAMDTGDDTETELEAEAEAARRERETTPQVRTTSASNPPGRASSKATSLSSESTAAYNTSAAARLAVDNDRELKKRQRQSMAESTGSISTDSEWEKVEDER